MMLLIMEMRDVTEHASFSVLPLADGRDAVRLCNSYNRLPTIIGPSRVNIRAISHARGIALTKA
jgi:hypothetical protein